MVVVQEFVADVQKGDNSSFNLRRYILARYLYLHLVASRVAAFLILIGPFDRKVWVVVEIFRHLAPLRLSLYSDVWVQKRPRPAPSRRLGAEGAKKWAFNCMFLHSNVTGVA
ncbi:hypothetical protein ACUH96_03765 [Dermabacteraceae bacterium P13077]